MYMHVVAISIVDNFTRGTEQYQWLENDLKQASKRLTDSDNQLEWIVLFGHTPMYSSSNGHTQGNKDLKLAMEELWNMYNVTLAIFGDDHGYERTYPVFQGKSNMNDYEKFNDVDTFMSPQSPIHIVTGTAGVGLDGWVDGAPPPWSAFREAKHGYLKVDVSKSRIRGKFVRVDGSIADEWAIIKPKLATRNTNKLSVFLWGIPLIGGLALFGGWRKKFFFLSTNAANKLT